MGAGFQRPVDTTSSRSRLIGAQHGTGAQGQRDVAIGRRPDRGDHPAAARDGELHEQLPDAGRTAFMSGIAR
jgi:hypothetical protein